MEQFNFLLGTWSLKYTVPKTAFSDEDTGVGEGTFTRALNDQYVFFDYIAILTRKKAQAHGIFAKDLKYGGYKYWWFEDSGNYLCATCNFLDENTLFLNRHDSTLIQTFEKIKPDQIVLKMSHPINKQLFEAILIVEFFRK
jgi:hypothetical protein